MDIGNGVTMTFTPDGNLVYVIHRERKDEKMNLVFSVDGDCLVTNQPSRRQTERTEFAFDAGDSAEKLTILRLPLRRWAAGEAALRAALLWDWRVQVTNYEAMFDSVLGIEASALRPSFAT
jgi:hypothetical protein